MVISRVLLLGYEQTTGLSVSVELVERLIHKAETNNVLFPLIFRDEVKMKT